VGGGSWPKPGEISLAHHGVLFLDELPEFPRHVLDVLREPLEAGSVTISRAGHSASFPARFQLIAAMNPCPCGYSGDPQVACRCSESQRQRYLSRLSGPFLDRIDLQIGVPRLDPVEMSRQKSGESSLVIRQRVSSAREIQQSRQQCNNAAIGVAKIDEVCQLIAKDQRLLASASRQFNLSIRAHYRILRVARTIADLAGQEQIKTQHLSEALSYRQLL